MIQATTTTTCPVCGREPAKVARTPCKPSECEKGHHWFFCLAHGEARRVIGSRTGRLDPAVCYCPRMAELEAP